MAEALCVYPCSICAIFGNARLFLSIPLEVLSHFPGKNPNLADFEAN